MATEIKDAIFLTYDEVNILYNILHQLEDSINDDDLQRLSPKYGFFLDKINEAKRILLDNSIVKGFKASSYNQEMMRESLTGDPDDYETAKKDLKKHALKVFPPPNAELLRAKALEYLKDEPIVVTEYDIKSTMRDLKEEIEKDLEKKRESWVNRQLLPYLMSGRGELRETKDALCCNWCQKPIGKGAKAFYGADYACCASCYAKGKNKGDEMKSVKESKAYMKEGYYFSKTGAPTVQPHRNPSEKYYLLDSPKSEWGFIVRHKDPEGKAIFTFNKSKELIDYINKTIFDGANEDDAYIVAKDLAEEYHKFTGPIFFKYDK